MYIPCKVATKIIRVALKERCKSLHVKMARGTAYGWIDIWASDYVEFTEEEKKAIREVLGLSLSGNCAVISPESREFYVRKAIEKSEKARRAYELWLMCQKIEK